MVRGGPCFIVYELTSGASAEACREGMNACWSRDSYIKQMTGSGRFQLGCSQAFFQLSEKGINVLPGYSPVEELVGRHGCHAYSGRFTIDPCYVDVEWFFPFDQRQRRNLHLKMS